MRLWNAASSWWRVVGDASSPHLSQLSCWSGTESHVKEWDSSSYKQSTRQSVNSRSTSAKCKWFGKEMMLTSHVVLNNVTREKPHVNDQLNRRRRLQDGGRSLEWDWVRRDKRTWCLISVINALWLTCLNKDVLISTWTHWVGDNMFPVWSLSADQVTALSPEGSTWTPRRVCHCSDGLCPPGIFWGPVGPPLPLGVLRDP